MKGVVIVSKRQKDIKGASLGLLQTISYSFLLLLTFLIMMSNRERAEPLFKFSRSVKFSRWFQLRHFKGSGIGKENINTYQVSFRLRKCLLFFRKITTTLKENPDSFGMKKNSGFARKAGK